jgi:hypothetical protein
MPKGEWKKEWWYTSDMDEIRSDESQVLSEFVSIDSKWGVK